MLVYYFVTGRHETNSYSYLLIQFLIPNPANMTIANVGTV